LSGARVFTAKDVVKVVTASMSVHEVPSVLQAQAWFVKPVVAPEVRVA
jgi:hypothetical protein